MLAKEPGPEAAAAVAQSALAANDLVAMEQAAAALGRHAPDLPETHVFLAIHQAAKGDLDGADAELDRAADRGYPAPQVARLRDGLGINEHRRHWLYAKIAGFVLGGWLLGMGLLFGVGSVMSRLTLQAIERHAGRPSALASETRLLRKGYGVAIGLAALYYYLSIPILILVTVGGAGALIYGFFVIGQVPVKLLAILGIGALVTMWAILKSLFVRRGPPVDPGRALPEAEAPQLWALLREVAERVGTRPVDKICLTAGTELAVTERGRLAQRLRDRGERLLILGAGALGGLSVAELRAIIAHEYGHFSNRDTAGGDVAMTVNASLMSTVVTLARSGVSSFNPTWQYLRIYAAFFARITRGASRLPEILADRFAAMAYGARAFCRGLENVVRRSVEFDLEVDQFVAWVQREQRPIANLYQPLTVEALQAQEREHAVQAALAAQASAYDSHPPPCRRMEWVMRLPEVAADASGDAPAWSLFPDVPLELA